MYKHCFKRFFDLLGSLVGIVLLLPIFFLIFFIILLIDRDSPFYLQARPGMNKHTFKVIKFKTMVNKTDKNGNLLPDSHRITRFGKFIRSTSLDEIPQLVNVLKGDMSFIGPRPLLIKYLPLYDERQARRHEVRPGMTGLAQIKGRNNLTWKEKFEYDIFYVENVSFYLDMRILLLTVKKVLSRQGINSSDSVTMEPFLGNS